MIQRKGNRHSINITATLTLLLIITSVITCKKFEPVPLLIIKTDTVSGEFFSSCNLSGTIVHLGEDGVTQHGFCWSESKNPIIESSLKNDLGPATSSGNFSSLIDGLEFNTTYYARAYATENAGTTYGNEISFTTGIPAVPAVITTAVSAITQSSAQSGGNITDDGGVSVTARGICWSTSQNPIVSDNKTSDGNGTGSYTSSITGLSCGTTYYVRAYATNEAGTAYGNQLDFVTDDCPEGIPTVTTTNISSFTQNSAQGGGNVTDEGSSSVTSRGVCWSLSQQPSISDDHTTDGTGTGAFSSELTGLECNTTYYVRAYATNASGTAYGAEVNFTTSPCSPTLPTVTTTAIANVTGNSAQSGGEVSDDGGASVTSRGVCWSTSQNPTIDDHKTTDGNGTGSFTSTISELTCGTTYYVRAYATNAVGTAYGNQIEFPTSNCPGEIPTVTTLTITNIMESSAQGGGNVTDEGTSSVTTRGVCWSVSHDPTIADANTSDGTGAGSFTSELTGLECNTTYYVRAYATNASGTAYGSEVDFLTSPCTPTAPTVTTRAVTNVTETSALSGGEVTDNGGDPVTARGVCWSTAHDPTTSDSRTTDGTGIGSFDSNLTGLSPNTTYYIRAYATNSIGTTYGNEESFITNPEQVVDFDGNIYQTVVIGEQTWMAENLKVTHYADGTAIPLVENDAMWNALDENGKAYCWNNNNSSIGDTYGALYSWAAAMNGAGSSMANPSGIQGVCPSGWHLPSDNEWKQLEMHLGMSQADADNTGWRGTNEGGKLKEAGTAHWNSPNTGASNESGFMALPGGNRYDYGTFFNVGGTALFWTTTEYNASDAMGRSLSYSIGKVYRSNYNKSNGFSVRCIRDD